MTTGRKLASVILALALSLSLTMGWPCAASAEEPSGEVNRFNVVLVIDKSGSLRAADGSGTDPDGLRFDAMRLFLGLLTESGNNVGAVVFDEGIRYDAELQAMEGMDEKKALIREVEAFTPSYDTDIGGAVLRATEMLQGMKEENGLPCMILLLTDGKTDFSANGQERKQASWAVARQALDAAKQEGVTINGILLNVDGQGDGGRGEFEIYTRETRGSFAEVTRPEDLAAAFRQFYSIINNTSYTGAQRVAFSDGGEAEFFFTVPSFGVEEVNVVVEHDTARHDVGLDTLVGVEIFNPDGSVYDYAGQEMVSSRYVLVKLPHPAVGEWRVRLAGEPEDWVDVTMVYNASMSISIGGDRPADAYRAYSPYHFTASVTDPGRERITKEDLQGLNAVLSVEKLSTGDVREYAMDPAENGYACDLSFLRDGAYFVSARVGVGAFEVCSAPMEVNVEPWPLVAKVTNITDIMQYGRFVDDCWEMELSELFAIEDMSGIRYALSDDLDGRLTIEDGVLRARFGDLDTAAFTLTASDLMGQSARVSVDARIPHVSAASKGVTNMLQAGRLGDHVWEMEVGGLFRDPKNCPLELTLSDDYDGRITLEDGLLQVDLRELREAAFSVTATDVLGARAEIPFTLKVPGPAASVREISETVKTGLLQEGIWEKDLRPLFRDPKGTALTYTLSDDLGGQAVMTDGTLKVDCKGLKKASFTVMATDEYDMSAELTVTLTEQNMTMVYLLYALAGLLGIAALIALVVFLLRRR